jgi:hypothetical protein
MALPSLLRSGLRPRQRLKKWGRQTEAAPSIVLTLPPPKLVRWDCSSPRAGPGFGNPRNTPRRGRDHLCPQSWHSRRGNVSAIANNCGRLPQVVQSFAAFQQSRRGPSPRESQGAGASAGAGRQGATRTGPTHHTTNRPRRRVVPAIGLGSRGLRGQTRGHRVDAGRRLR